MMKLGVFLLRFAKHALCFRVILMGWDVMSGIVNDAMQYPVPSHDPTMHSFLSYLGEPVMTCQCPSCWDMSFRGPIGTMCST